MTQKDNSPANRCEGTILRGWMSAKESLDLLRKIERGLRDDLVAAFFPDITTGSFRKEMEDGQEVRLTVPTTFQIDQASFEASFQEMEELGIDVGELVTWKPSLNKKAYDRLDGEQREAVDKHLTMKAGAPQVKVLEPETV